MNDYERFDDCLAALGADANAAEMHGSLCGALCALGELSDADWLAMAAGAARQTPTAAEREVLLAVAEQTRSALNDSNLGFTLILPADEASLAEQALALGDWCRGFLYGLSHGGIQELETLPGDAAEVVTDLLEISRIGVEDAEVEAEAAEQQLLELGEYVRMGVLLVNEELQPLHTPPPATVH